MTETLRKKIVTVLVWVLIITPVHIAMGSVMISNSANSDDQISQSVASSESDMQTEIMHSTVTQEHQKEHQDDGKHSKSDSHCEQDTGCSGCDTCNHCLNVICTDVITDLSFSNFLNIPTLFPLHQAESSAAFRPPRHS